MVSQLLRKHSVLTNCMLLLCCCPQTQQAPDAAPAQPEAQPEAPKGPLSPGVLVNYAGL